MSGRKWAALIIGSLSLLTCLGCYGLGQEKPELLRRYNTDLGQGDKREPGEAWLSAFVVDVPDQVPASALPPLLRLGDHGQMAFIQGLRKEAEEHKAGDRKDLAAELKDSLATAEARGDKWDKNSRTVQVVFSAYRDWDSATRNPADRISRLQVKLSDLPKGIIFTGWNLYATQYKDADLGLIKLEKKQEQAAKLSPTFSGTLIGTGELSLSRSSTQNEEFNVKQRYITLSGMLKPKDLTIFQESVSGIDLTGNFSANVILEFKPSDSAEPSHRFIRLGPLWNGPGKPKDPEQVTFEIVKTIRPLVANLCKEQIEKLRREGITCQVSGNYSLRHVESDPKYLTEGLHDIRQINKDLKVENKTVVLVSPREVRKFIDRYRIYHAGEPKGVLRKSDPYLGSSTQESVAGTLPLEFETLEQALDFWKWIRKVNVDKATGPDFGLTIGDTRLTRKMIGNLRICRSKRCEEIN